MCDVSSSTTVRPITAADVEAVIALDQQVSGRSRRGFYQKRFAAFQRDPSAFVWLVAVQGDTLAGFVSAHVLDGEFGETARTAVVDAIGTHPDHRGQGLGHTLMAALEGALRPRNVKAMRSEADWTEQDLVRFFAKAGFQLAPQIVLQCACHQAPSQ
ncbi:hypothetical protein RHODGE_RHODGE_03649 [Rhodoplanes serenus]|uniref:N-acetyltransferase domain-containing protein n=1 Tax=Rhodoplanes serenus TaxID=200615 RepID=A0A447CXC9_9BRAD|nr:hypothetical protein RHODGE_RHODGE_03649 [Rhodoplanes serenus]